MLWHFLVCLRLYNLKKEERSKQEKGSSLLSVSLWNRVFVSAKALHVLYQLIHFRIFHHSSSCSFLSLSHLPAFSSLPPKSFAGSQMFTTLLPKQRIPKRKSLSVHLHLHVRYLSGPHLQKPYKLQTKRFIYYFVCFLVTSLHFFPLFHSLFLQIIYCLTPSPARTATLQTSVACITTICHHRPAVCP